MQFSKVIFMVKNPIAVSQEKNGAKNNAIKGVENVTDFFAILSWPIFRATLFGAPQLTKKMS